MVLSAVATEEGFDEPHAVQIEATCGLRSVQARHAHSDATILKSLEGLTSGSVKVGDFRRLVRLPSGCDNVG
jgi:hypothetical protein